jgi:hypothetical protein
VYAQHRSCLNSLRYHYRLTADAAGKSGANEGKHGEPPMMSGLNWLHANRRSLATACPGTSSYRCGVGGAISSGEGVSD